MPGLLLVRSPNLSPDRRWRQPFTPEEAMLLMKDRWKAMKKMRTGTVINVEYAMI